MSHKQPVSKYGIDQGLVCGSFTVCDMHTLNDTVQSITMTIKCMQGVTDVQP